MHLSLCQSPNQDDIRREAGERERGGEGERYLRITTWSDPVRLAGGRVLVVHELRLRY